jgi:hypothetical protein
MRKQSKTSRKLLVMIVLLIALASATAIATNRWWTQQANASSNVSIPGPVASAPPAPQISAGGRAEAELVKLTSKGFEPAEITRPAGKFLLGVTNRTGLPELSLRLIHESRRSVDGKRLGHEMGWHRVLDLPAGNYVLREASHPDWVCRVTITAH